MKMFHSKFCCLVAAALTFPAAIHSTLAASWVATGSMATQRELATATLLTNSLVLVAGGFPVGFPIATTELYNPATHSWSAGGSMTYARERHAAILLPNGKVLVAGGYNGSQAIQYCELYDSSLNTWSLTGPMSTNCQAHSLVLLTNGQVLRPGGQTLSAVILAACELYNPATQTWTNTGSMKSPRLFYTATLLPSGCVLVTGGETNASTITASAEVYDPNTQIWTNTAPMNFARAGHAAVLLPNGKVLVAGGAPCTTCGALTNAEIFDPVTSTWTPTGSTSVPHVDELRLTAILLPSGNVLLAGGMMTNNTPAISNAELYNPGTGTWSMTASMNVARAFYMTTLLINSNSVLAAGGGPAPTPTAELYQPDASLAINLVSNQFAGLTIASPVGYQHSIQYVTNLTNTNWTTLTNVSLPTNPFVFIDYGSTSQPVRFYRDVP